MVSPFVSVPILLTIDLVEHRPLIDVVDALTKKAIVTTLQALTHTLQDGNFARFPASSVGILPLSVLALVLPYKEHWILAQ
jgi:4-hydroxy-L-threonine phosphate dehydrogenase PdxA